MPAWWGVYGWFFGVAIAGGIYYGLRATKTGVAANPA
jgi:NCS1 family nucleobase:cation symporter-1